MKGMVFVCLLLFVPSLLASTIHHNIKAKVFPSEHRIVVEDKITLADGMPLEFVIALHTGLKLDSSGDNNLSISPIGESRLGSVPIRRYSVSSQSKSFTLRYQGKIFHPIVKGKEFARSVSDSPGLISSDGVFLSHGSVWYPLFENSPSLSFKLDVHLPKNWKAVSQGDRLHEEQNGEGYNIVWQDLTSQEEIYLIAAQFSEYKKSAGAVEALAFLRAPDPALAQRYLDVTAQYIEMYRQLIGPYPYTKFALVENFWESGFGMPSFTLLGPQVIRLPFILHSSYPHEILHNWWGNSVYVDFSQGNWAEGMTSYLADHLIREQKNKGGMARRSVLQNYTDFTKEKKEFALSEFRSRHSATSEAIGYGKAQMFFHMLRVKIGDQAFIKGLHQLYMRYKFKEAGYDDLQKIFSGVAGQDLSNFFQQWVTRAGSPRLVIQQAQTKQQGDGWQLRLQLSQQQDGDAYELNVPIAVTLAGQGRAYQETVVMNAREKEIEISLAARPLRIDIDPEFDIFRRLDRAEIPPALSQAFGAEKMLIVLPSAASATMLEAYKGLVSTWEKSQPAAVEFAMDNELDSLPKGKTVWLLGWNNRFAPLFQQQMQEYFSVDVNGAINVNDKSLTPEQHSVVLVGRDQDDGQNALVWLATSNPKAVPGLARKLPHYRKYSYLAFVDDEPVNVVKNQWPVLRSPMTYVLDAGVAVARGKLTKRHALIELPSLFDSEQLMQDVKVLADPVMEGRGLGGEGIDRAANAIVEMFRTIGLQRGNPQDNSYIQQWSQPVEGLGDNITMKNVIGYIPGSNPKYDGQSVVVSAHYDHLGMGWPDVREEYKGQIHLGADDNASGVAVMMSLARLAAKNWKPERSIVFIAFTGEEAGRLGSMYYVDNPIPFPLDKIMGVVNLDTVGRLGNAPVSVFGTASASEWVHIFRGIGFVTGVSIKPIPKDVGSSDQKSFMDKGIPGVQLFAAPHADFHTPNDTVDKLDVAGMEKMAMVLKEAVEYLIARPEPLTVKLPNSQPKAMQSRKRVQGRRVSVGTVPDFAFQGEGVFVSDVVPDSPAEKAGMKAGDVITQVNGKAVSDLASYAKMLRNLAPGDTIEIKYQRGAAEHTVKLSVVER